MKKVLIASPIRQKPAILRQFLDSLSHLKQAHATHHYCFIDDNDQEASRQLLHSFAEKRPCTLLASESTDTQRYLCNETTHFWNQSIIWKVAQFKDRLIDYAREKQYDFLFLIDSDLVLHPNTVDHLVQIDKEIVANIFWTKWQPNQPPLPQVWLTDTYNQFEFEPGERVTEQDLERRHQQFLDKLHQAGTYEVGGLGACTLIGKKALDQPISFQRIHNITFWGEDRHFCVRAAALGIPLHVNTHYPAYHIYRESDLPGVEDFKVCCGIRRSTPRVTLSLIMRNEAHRYLGRMLEAIKPCITDAVLIDDGSTDQSVKIAEEVLQGIPLKLIKNPTSTFANEIALRKQQWEATLATNPDWILCLDADEIFEPSFKEGIKEMISHPEIDAYCFRLFDMWSETHYRSDSFWRAHLHYRPFLIRHKPDRPFQWNEMPQHCGRMPVIAFACPKIAPYRLKHYGWARKEDRLDKYNRYKKLDPEARYGWKEQYDSILDETPHLVAWKD